jgi:hypothetical protein
MNAARQPTGPVPTPQAAPTSTTAAPAAPLGGDADPLLAAQPPRPSTAGGGCPAAASSSHALVGSSVLQEASYSVTYGERGAGVVLVASEPITGSTTDWVSIVAVGWMQKVLPGVVQARPVKGVIAYWIDTLCCCHTAGQHHMMDAWHLSTGGHVSSPASLTGLDWGCGG